MERPDEITQQNQAGREKGNVTPQAQAEKEAIEENKAGNPGFPEDAAE